MSDNDIWDIRFSSVNKEFVLGGFSDVLRRVFGLEVKCPMVQALRDISFRTNQGELLGVLGPNGAGKSTLLKVAGGVYHPDAGKVYVRQNPTAIYEMGLLGNENLSGREFCNVYFNFRDIPKEKRAALVEEVREFSELEEYFEERIRTYSSGMLARLFFGVVTAVPASVILLDEILCIGDEYFQGKSFKRLMKMITRGTSGILVSHDWFRAMRLCTKIIILNQGMIEFQGTAQEAVREYLKPNIQTTKRVFFHYRKEMQAKVLYYECGEPFSFSFEVESTIEEPFCIGLAFEIPKLSVVAILSNNNLVADQKGFYRITLRLPAFPISFHECYLSLFLYKPRLQSQNPTEEGFDQISWTTGESIRMVNSKPRQQYQEAIFHHRFAWRRIS